MHAFERLPATLKFDQVSTSLLSLGRGLGMEIVAEGVETEAEASVMRLVGVTEMQGFFFSHAVPPEQVDALVASLCGTAAVQPAVLAPVQRRSV